MENFAWACCLSVVKLPHYGSYPPRLTMRFQSKATDVTHGPVWEALPAIELLLEHLETMKAVYREYPQPADPLPRSCALTPHALSLRCDLAHLRNTPRGRLFIYLHHTCLQVALRPPCHTSFEAGGNRNMAVILYICLTGILCPGDWFNVYVNNRHAALTWTTCLGLDYLP